MESSCLESGGQQLTRSFQTGGGGRGGESSATSNRHSSSDTRQVEPRKFLQKVETVDTDIRETKDCSRKKLRESAAAGGASPTSERGGVLDHGGAEEEVQRGRRQQEAERCSHLDRGEHMRMRFDNEEELLFVARKLDNDHAGDLCWNGKLPIEEVKKK